MDHIFLSDLKKLIVSRMSLYIQKYTPTVRPAAAMCKFQAIALPPLDSSLDISSRLLLCHHLSSSHTFCNHTPQITIHQNTLLPTRTCSF